jgi:predicted  nucleic acid-binding Zn-ribbon protein
MAKKLDTAEFIRRAILIHGTKYLYEKIVYLRCDLAVIITCREHGDFTKEPIDHINNKKSGCPECGKIKQQETRTKYTVVDVDTKLKSKNMKRLSPYLGSSKRIEIRCLVCTYRWDTTFFNINIQDHGCPACNDVTLSNDDVDLFIIKNNLNIMRMDNYIHYDVKINWRCLCCGEIWKNSYHNIMSKLINSCPDCSCRKNEKIVKNFLKENNIIFEKIEIKLPINIRRCRPDFYIPSMNLIIEYNGDHHYRPVTFGGSMEKALKKFEYQQIRDSQLRTYCKENNIILEEIDGRKYVNVKLIDYLCSLFNIDKMVA